MIDGNGLSEIVVIFLTLLETEDAISKMVSIFKKFNEAWINTKLVMTDKDFIERVVFQKEFPSSLIICLFHTMRSFRREISCEKLGLHPGEREHALELIEKIIYSKSQEEYECNYQQLLESNLKNVIDYYNINWHPIKDQWVECFKGANLTFGKTTNNRLESLNAKIKSVCIHYATLSTFLKQFFALLSCLHNERNHITLMSLVKKTILPDKSPLQLYAKFIIPYAFKYLQQQFFVEYDADAFVADKEDASKFLISSSEGQLSLNDSFWQCKFWNCMNIPC